MPPLKIPSPIGGPDLDNPDPQSDAAAPDAITRPPHRVSSTDDPDAIAATPVQTGHTEMASPEMVAQLRAELAASRGGDDAPALNPPPVIAAVPPPVTVDDLSDLEGPEALLQARARVYARVAATLAPSDQLPPRDAKTRGRARAEAQRLLAELAARVPDIDPRPWANRIAGELCGMGALSAPLAEPAVVRIVVNGPHRVLVQHHGGPLEAIDAVFSCAQAVGIVLRRLTGASFSADHPVVDARTLDGADVHAIHESVATGGPQVSITLPAPTVAPTTLTDLVDVGALDAATAALLSAATCGGLNILLCGGPGAQTFPLLAALATAGGTQRQVLTRPGHEAAPLPKDTVQLHGHHHETADDRTIMQSLVRAALSLSPERVLFHEVAGPEAADALAALGRGLQGGVISTRARTVEEAITRLASLVGLTGVAPIPAEGHASTHGAHAQYVATTFDLAVGLARFADGVSKVVQLSEPAVDAQGSLQVVDLALWDDQAKSCNTTGTPPGFIADLRRRGVEVDALVPSNSPG